MKYSRYNSFYTNSGINYIYNSKTGKVCELHSSFKCLMLNFLPEEIRDLHIEFYEFLCENEFIISDDIDEVEDVIIKANKLHSANDEFWLFVNPTMDCNFSCWYCYENKKESIMGKVIQKRIFRLLKNIANNMDLKIIHLSFFGGEPMLQFYNVVLPIIDNIIHISTSRKLKLETSFTTNGYLIDCHIIECLKERLDDCSFQITLDGDCSEHNKVRFQNFGEDSYNIIINNIKKLIFNDFYVRIRINCTNQNYYSIENIISDFEDLTEKQKKNLIFDFHQVWQDKANDRLEKHIESLRNIFNNKGFDFSKKYSINNMLSPCYADKENSVVVNYDGNIYKCTARNFDEENSEGIINSEGQLMWNKNHRKLITKDCLNIDTCFPCKIFPICLGGCSQHLRENNEVCVYSSEEIDMILKNKIEQAIINSKQKNDTPLN